MDYQGDTGGGFQSGGGGGGGSQSQSTPARGGGRRSYDDQTLIPVTINQIVNAKPDAASGNDGVILADGRKVTSIVLVAAVRSFEDMSTNVMYSMEDGTGLMEVKQWLDDNNECSAMHEIRQSTLRENIYLKIIGQIKDYDGKKLVVASSVRPLSTGNELTHHMLQVIYSSEKSKRADSIVAPASVGGVGFGAPIQEPSTGRPAGDNPVQQAVLEYIKTEGEASEMGADIKGVFAQLQQYPEAQIRQVVEDLGSEGQIYSTIDEDHYKYAM